MYPVETIVAAMADLLLGESIRATARQYGCSVSTARLWHQQARKLLGDVWGKSGHAVCRNGVTNDPKKPDV